MSKKSKARKELLRQHRKANKAAKKQAALSRRHEERAASRGAAYFKQQGVTKEARRKIREAAEDKSQQAQIAKFEQWKQEAEERAKGINLSEDDISAKQQAYDRREDLTRKYLQMEYWSLTEAAVQGRYEEALRNRKQLLKNLLEEKKEEYKKLEEEYTRNPTGENANKLRNKDIELEELEDVIYINDHPESAVHSGDPLGDFFG